MFFPDTKSSPTPFSYGILKTLDLKKWIKKKNEVRNLQQIKKSSTILGIISSLEYLISSPYTQKPPYMMQNYYMTSVHELRVFSHFWIWRSCISPCQERFPSLFLGLGPPFCYLFFLSKECSVRWVYSYISGYSALNIQIPFSCLPEASLPTPGVQDPLPLPPPQEEGPLIWGTSSSVLLPLVYCSLHCTVGKTLGF